MMELVPSFSGYHVGINQVQENNPVATGEIGGSAPQILLCPENIL